MGEATNLEIMQRINAMLENSLDLSNLTGEVASKRNYSGNINSFYNNDSDFCNSRFSRLPIDVGFIFWFFIQRKQWKSDCFPARRCFGQSIAATSTEPSFEATSTGATKSNEIVQPVIAVS